MITPLRKLDINSEEFALCVNALNEKYDKSFTEPLRFTFSELRSVAEFLYSDTNTSQWGVDYHDNLMKRFNYLEYQFICNISKNLDSPEKLKELQYSAKIKANATRRVCNEVIAEFDKNKSLGTKLKGVFKRA